MKTKKIVMLLLAVVLALSLAACGAATNGTTGGDAASSQSGGEKSQAPSAAPSADAFATDSVPAAGKILVAYFSATNNTEDVAQKLAGGLNADLYEITPEEPYSTEDLGYSGGETRASRERDDPDARPAISGAVENMAQYDVVFLGYPIWWGEAPRILSTFIESYDFTGKTIAPFCTSGSSEFGSSDAALQAAAPGAKWLEGHRFAAGASAKEILAWANALDLG